MSAPLTVGLLAMTTLRFQNVRSASPSNYSAPSTLCPATGTPVPGGLSFQEATLLVAEVARSGRRIVGFDLNEVAPGPNGDEWNGNVAARVLYRRGG